MKGKEYFVVPGTQKNRELYVSPEVETVDIQVEDLIAASADNVDVRDPWGDSSETDW